VIGGIALPNPASERLHEKLGFTKVAHFPEVGSKFGKWIDVAYWQLILVPGAHDAPPSQPNADCSNTRTTSDRDSRGRSATCQRGGADHSATSTRLLYGGSSREPLTGVRCKST